MRAHRTFTKRDPARTIALVTKFRAGPRLLTKGGPARSAIKRKESRFAPVRLQRSGRGPAMPPRYSSDGPAAPRKASD